MEPGPLSTTISTAGENYKPVSWGDPATARQTQLVVGGGWVVVVVVVVVVVGGGT
jgi:hypothetical protein